MPSLFATAEDRIAGYARVGVERAVDRYPEGLTYAIPESLQTVRIGERVLVPLGRGDAMTPGYVIELVSGAGIDESKVKFIAGRDESSAIIPCELLELAKWISGYYCAPIGMTLSAMLPAAVKRNIGATQRTMIDLVKSPPADAALPPKQRGVLEAMATMASGQRPMDQRDVAELAGLKTLGPIRKLIERGFLEVSLKTTVEAVWQKHAIDAFVPESLTRPQLEVIDRIGGTIGGGFQAHLLYGVTGSGKTEVYIRLIERALGGGRSAMLLVPEISLTPQTGGRLIGRFPNHRVAVLHSGLTAAQRHQQWSLVADNRADVVLGARSAVFAPIPDGRLGLIIIDEEHDGSYKQDQVPRYHGRDVAVRRAQIAGCPIVLGSATPSLESWHNATERKNYVLHRLAERAPGMKLPRVQVVDFMAERKRRHDGHIHLIGPTMEELLGRTLEGGGQALILLNRRGYANYIACPAQSCGWVMTCDDCDVTMVFHVHKELPTGGFVQCHHCLTQQKLPEVCPDCGRRIVTFGLGTQRVEEELTKKFPALVGGESMLRVDSDSMHGAEDFHNAMTRFGSGEIRVMLGTQMIAKGLDFPGVRLVGVINADTSINLPDFRAGERTFQLVNQVAGRCGRSEHPGVAIVQTFNPTDPCITMAARHDYEAFARTEIEHRRRAGLPPTTRMARIVIRDADHKRCAQRANEVAEAIRLLAESMGAPTFRVRPAAPCPIARLAGKHRWQVEVMAPSAARMQQLLTRARTDGLIRSSAEMAVDVDPLAML